MSSTSPILNRAVSSFPSVCIPSTRGVSPVEVTLIGQIGHGAGTQLVREVSARQSTHGSFVNALDEPSAKIGGVHSEAGDRSSLYSFVVGNLGHPFHRHAGNRVFTAISGSGGAQLRFSDAALEGLEQSPQAFVDSMQLVDIPPDCLFTVRFGSGTWHQFAPLDQVSRNPAFLALSCHTDELAGLQQESQRADVLANRASIASLTEVLPESVQALVDVALRDPDRVRRTALSLEAPADSWRSWLCLTVRGVIGRWRGAWGAWKNQSGFASLSMPELRVEPIRTAPAESLLHSAFAGQRIDHDDSFRCVLRDNQLRGRSASELLDALLQAFVDHPPSGVSGLMMLRNALVRPLRLRRSHLGCPISSLASSERGTLFACRHPVLAQAVSEEGDLAQVLLGADDRHLRFRTCVAVRKIGPERVEFVLSSRVHCLNAFGCFYMAAIDRVHRRYVSPTLLRSAVAAVLTPAVIAGTGVTTSLAAEA